MRNVLGVVVLMLVGCGGDEPAAMNPPRGSTVRQEPCDCGNGTMGVRVVYGELATACGCGDPDGAMIMTPAPRPPAVRECPADGTCPPYEEPITDTSATSCCTPEGQCGSTDLGIFGALCIERQSPPPIYVNNNDECPDEGAAFVDLRGCCMPNGQCGLAMYHLANWQDVGCMPRDFMREQLNLNRNNGRQQLGEVFQLTEFVEATWSIDPISCDPVAR